MVLEVKLKDGRTLYFTIPAGRQGDAQSAAFGMPNAFWGGSSVDTVNLLSGPESLPEGATIAGTAPGLVVGEGPGILPTGPLAPEEETSYISGFRRGLQERGTPVSGGSPFSRFLASQFPGYRATAMGQRAFETPVSGAGPEGGLDVAPLLSPHQTMQTFARETPFSALPGAASSVFQTMLDRSRELAGEAPSAVQQPWLTPSITDEAIRAANLALMAARQRYGTFAPALLPGAGEIGQQYMAQPTGGAARFAPFANRLLGLGM